VVRADTERNLLLLRGPVPGPKNGLVTITATVIKNPPPKAAPEAKK
jgi:ribosomal protein L3